jgi:hypothetical protein
MWKDPVMSKIIAAIIIAVGSLIINAFNSIINDIGFDNSVMNFLTYKIELWIILLTIFIVIGFLVIQQLIKKKFAYSPDTLKLDRKLFNEIKSILNEEHTIDFLRTNNFAGFSFDTDRLGKLYDIEHENKRPEFEFLNPKLECIKTEMIKNVSDFTSLISFETFPTSTGRQSIPEEWETEQPDRFYRVTNEISRLQHQIVDNYEDLIKIGRRILEI